MVREDVADLIDAVDGEGAGDHTEHGEGAAHDDQEVQELLYDLAALVAEGLEDRDLVAHGGDAHADDDGAGDDRQHLVVVAQGGDHIVGHRVDDGDQDVAGLGLGDVGGQIFHHELTVQAHIDDQLRDHSGEEAGHQVEQNEGDNGLAGDAAQLSHVVHAAHGHDDGEKDHGHDGQLQCVGKYGLNNVEQADGVAPLADRDVLEKDLIQDIPHGRGHGGF